ncbi:unnamed protein product [Clonostachys rosea]|uniref:Altered inheritance of mitochondria protein 24, mitochondrial n=1 Tax=Bionectria ochroleuca TaxID=29856 RepID=A0ABY6V263_BIOOC|nr:unnamed protein product [Clonostachys rosea]
MDSQYNTGDFAPPSGPPPGHLSQPPNEKSTAFRQPSPPYHDAPPSYQDKSHNHGPEQKRLTPPRDHEKSHHIPNASQQPGMYVVQYPGAVPQFPPEVNIKSKTSWTGRANVEAGPLVATLGMSGRTEFLVGGEQGQKVAEATAENMLQHSAALLLNGFSTQITYKSSNYFFSAPVNGAMLDLEWRVLGKRSKMKRFFGGVHSLELVTPGAAETEEPFAIWHPTGGYLKRDGDIGHLEFHGRALSGEMGEVFNLLAVMTIIKVYFMIHEANMKWSVYGAAVAT